jgi:HEAT repeat protein
MVLGRKLDSRPAWSSVVGVLVLGGAIVGTIALLASCKGDDSNVVLIQKIGEGRVANEEQVRFLLERLDQGSVEERVSAAWALAQTGRTDALPELTRAATDDPNSDVRINAIASIDLLGGETATPALLDFLEDEDEQVLAAALRGLADSPDPELVPKVGPLLVDGGDVTRALAVDVLGSCGNPEAIPFLAQVADDADFDVRTRVAFAMGKLRDPSALPTLVAMLDDERWEVRANAVQALGMIGDRSTRSAVEPLTNDPNSMVRQTADAALEKLR